MANPLTQQQLLDVVERAFPDSYIQPLKNVGHGFEILQAYAKIGERCSLAVSRAEDDSYIGTARGGIAAQVEVIFYRTSSAAGAVTVLKGTLVRASGGGQVFRTAEDAVFGALDLEVAVNAIAIGYGYEYNVEGKYTAPNGDSSPGEIDTVLRPLQDPPFGDPSIKVRNDAPADGLGRPATLDAHGAEIEVPRSPGESDENYRLRLRALPDTITPAAFRRQLAMFFKPYAIEWWLIETWQPSYQTCFDAPDIVPQHGTGYSPSLFTFDDPRTHVPVANRWLDDNDCAAAGIVEMRMPEYIRDHSFVYDDPGVAPADFESSLGRRAMSAYDFPETFPPPRFGGAYDGPDVGIAEMFAGLADLLRNIKAAGVKLTIHIAGED